ncbi:ABC transporter ATP-binding protein [Actinomyces faecalis]|uniref:ABC transporter ATP-binding protein n=1 Tax=Actinomyces faecalis TaxID=2722820 RepID=UPI001553B393|nr:ATP-binding cassette domain-containing protein [Actinomyces faecalis]
MLQISHLSKRFGSLQALDEMSFHVGDDELVGFVGANGAGKSTTMRIAMGVLEADSGTVTWDGRPVDADLRRRIGYMPEERGLYPKMKVAAQLTYLARLHGVSKARAQEAALEWTQRLGIETRRGDEVQKLSLGNQQRVQLAAALVADPALLILDEPFSGLDPVAVDVMSQVLRERADAGVPTLFSSHQLDVVERLCDRIVIIRSGRLVADGTIDQLAATAAPRWRVVVDDGAAAAGTPDATSQTTLSPHFPALAGLPQVEVSRDSRGRLVVTASGQDEQELLAATRPLGTVRELGPVRKPLTEIFREALTAPADDTDDTQEAQA